MLSLLPIALVGALATEELRVRPWLDTSSSRAEFEQRQSQLQTPDQHLNCARWCASRGLFAEYRQALEAVLKAEPDHAEARGMLGSRFALDQWIFEEVSRFTESPAPLPPLPPVAENRVKALFKDRDRPMKGSSRASYFDLQTDLAPEPLVFYARTLEKHFGRLKTRFRAYTGDPIEVLVFAHRSDYLRFYERYVGEGGEHVLGFYYNDQLYFYDDPFDRSNVANTARHECTHLLIDRFYSYSHVPKWIHEGMACYFAGACDEALGTYTSGLAYRIIHGIQSGKDLDVSELLDADGSEFKYDHYARSWSLIYYLNASKLEKKFQSFLLDLRDQLDGETTRRDAYAICSRQLEESLGRHPGDLEDGWGTYFVQEFALTSPEQLLDYAEYLLESAFYGSREYEDRQQVVDQALHCLDRLPERVDAALSERQRYLQMLVQIRRLSLTIRQPSAFRIGLRQILAALKEWPTDQDRATQGHLAFLTLDVTQALYPEPEAYPFSAREALMRWGQGSKSDDMAAASVVALFDDLLKLCRESFVKTLNKDPVHRQALFDSLILAMEFHPDSLEDLFPYLRLLVELEPDDVNQAALAAAYGGLGDSTWARSLLSLARDRALLRSQVDRFGRYIR
jgi:hypothetical protein